ncbi:TetR/AcrR family transcriptional regulator [Microbacterium sp. NE2HP2]|uniref:TetR/AcrR family transcriptional regulator n=1 Tax=Microbacterium TaxID=33882 RepID=UPI00236686F7|nr:MULTISPECIES: TetR/AcrR family transcriptional regulator [Microbacterium]MDD7944745.1 TetR/AcrR family transcriptional regulator [Microbacterium plantarum]WHE35096.1 TetR/AcrR family transcriptional regulator [Microbacterium sp. BDGP8]
MSDARPVRQGQEQKRSAILAAARELFVEVGVERSSMDAVSARAGVSKRTVYDYYGDKRRLLLGVVESAGETAVNTLRELSETHLPDTIAIDGRDELHQAVIAFAAELGGFLATSTNYAAAVKLISENESLLPELEDHPLDRAHADVLAERFAHFATEGLLDLDDPGLAAEHFHALTTLRVLNEPARRRTDAERVRQIMTDGAGAFLRAYGPRAR